MSFFIGALLCSLAVFDILATFALPNNKYALEKQNLIDQEQKMAFGSKIQLTKNEMNANKCLMDAKWKEVDDAFQNPTKFLPARNFLLARKGIEQSEVFKILKLMPKGAVSHIHTSALTSIDFLMTMLNEPNLYICLDKNRMKFQFFKKPDTTCDWKLYQTMRKNNIDLEKNIRNSLELHYTNIGDVNGIWSDFESIVSLISGLISYRPVFEKFIYQGMQEHYDDNIMFLELRSGKTALYELDGSRGNHMDVVKILKELSDKFVKTHPGFMGMKLIFAPFRKVTGEKFENYMKIFREMKAAYPDFVIGFDLVGQEDLGYPLDSFSQQLQQLSKETSLYFHAGETNWYGHKTDANLYDALLMNAKRIGHGYALLKHPHLAQAVKAKGIAIELSPISNQVLSLVQDLRNHPASYFFANDFPVVVSNDDPNMWGSRGLSYDFYETFVGIMSRDADLKALKQLAMNSITYSGLTDKEKREAFVTWNAAWDKFVGTLAKRC